ncbi:MAG: YfhO family protein [Thermoanaerobaculia bacterium]
MNPGFLYLAAIYLVLVALARRGGLPIPWKIAALFYVAVLAFFLLPLTGPYVNVPVDYLYRTYPWSAFGRPLPHSNPELNDLVFQIVPWAHQVRQSFLHGEMPLWNPMAGGGYPLLGNAQSSAFSFFRLIALPLSLVNAIVVEAALKLLVALTFTFIYVRRRGGGPIGATAAAFAFGFSTWSVTWVHFPLATVGLLLPLLLVAIDLVLEKPGYGRWLFLTFAFLALLTGGHPETVALVVGFGGCYTVVVAIFFWKEIAFRRVFAVAGAGIAGFLLALPVVLPFIEALPSSQRFRALVRHPEGWTVSGARDLVTFLEPKFFGSLPMWNIWGPAQPEVITGYAGIIAIAAWFVCALVLPLRRSMDRLVWLWFLLAPLSLTVALGWRPLAPLLHQIPPFSMTVNGRFRIFVCWSLAMLAGVLVDLVARKKFRVEVTVGVAIALALLAVPFFLIHVPDDAARSYALWSIAPAIGALVLLAVVMWIPPRFATGASAVLALVIFAELWSVHHRWNPVVSDRDFYPATPLIRTLERLESDRRLEPMYPFRIVALFGTLFPNTSAMYGLEDIRAHDPMANARMTDPLRYFTSYETEYYFGKFVDPDETYVDYANVRYVVTAPDEPAAADHFQLVYKGPDGRIYRNRTAYPRFFAVKRLISEFDDRKRSWLLRAHDDWRGTAIVKRLPTSMVDAIHADLMQERSAMLPPAKVRILHAEARAFDLRVESTHWTFIASSQPDWPGWRVYRNGGEELKVIQVNGPFMGFLVPPGTSLIRVVYNPLSFYTAAQVSGGILVVLLGLVPAIRAIRRRKLRRSDGEAPGPATGSST